MAEIIIGIIIIGVIFLLVLPLVLIGIGKRMWNKFWYGTSDDDPAFSEAARHGQRSQQSTTGSTHTSQSAYSSSSGSAKKSSGSPVFDADEGTYVDFEEVK